MGERRCARHCLNCQTCTAMAPRRTPWTVDATEKHGRMLKCGALVANVWTFCRIRYRGSFFVSCPPLPL